MMSAPEDNLFPAPEPERAGSPAPEWKDESAGASEGLADGGGARTTSEARGWGEISARGEAISAERESRLRANAAASHVPSRRATLVALGFGVAALLAWTVLQREGFFDMAGPREIVRAQVDDLGHGQLRAAYDLFSPRYRQQVPFSEWRELVVTHWRVFRTRELRFGDNEESNGRAVLETHLVAESGDRYVARFTLVRAEGRWWVDDLRWSEESEERGRVST